MKIKIIIIIINSIVGGLLVSAIMNCIDLSKKYEEQFDRLRIIENERNALSDAIRCYADSADTTIGISKLLAVLILSKIGVTSIKTLKVVI